MKFTSDRRKIYFVVLVVLFISNVESHRKNHHDATKRLLQERYTRTLQGGFFDRSPYHMIYFKHNTATSQHTAERRNTLNYVSSRKFVKTDPMDQNRRKYIIATPQKQNKFYKSEIDLPKNKHEVKKNSFQLHHDKEVKKTIKTAMATTAMDEMNVKPKSVSLKFTRTHQSSSDPMDRHRKKYFVQKTGTRKDEISPEEQEYLYEPEPVTIKNDLYPLMSDGDKRHSLSSSHKEVEHQLTIGNGHNKPGGIFNAAREYDSKPLEFYLSEKNGHVKLSEGTDAEKHFEKSHLDNQLPGPGPKNRFKETQDYIHQVLGSQLEADQKGSPSILPSYPAEKQENSFTNRQPDMNMNLMTAHPSVLHESDHIDQANHLPIENSRLPIENSHLPIENSHLPIENEEEKGKYDETKAEENNSYGDNPTSQENNQEISTSQDVDVKNQEHRHSNDELREDPAVINDKIKNFNRLMDRLHRVGPGMQRQPGLAGPELQGLAFHEPERQHFDDEQHMQQGGISSHEEYPTYQQENENQVPTPETEARRPFYPDVNNEGFHGSRDDRDYGRTAPLYANVQEPMLHNDNNRFQTAFQLTKAIMNGAKSIDNPSSGRYDGVNGQTLIPEVFEAFSKTNNDLKQRYDALQQWALTRSTTATEHDLKHQIQNLNELSNMVRLVNNLEKDMLKTILKRRHRYGDYPNDLLPGIPGMGFKHGDIPRGSKEEEENKPIKNPADVHDLLQYIYDNYIENRTADEIPVVLQAFQKSLTDIVSMKQVNSTDAAGNRKSNNTSALKESLDLLAKQSSYNLDDDALSNFNFNEHYGKEGFFHDAEKAASRDQTGKGDEGGHKITKFVDKQQKSPVITVKLLKALDLFLDSIEIGRKIKRFRSKVEDITKSMDGKVLLTSSMKQSLGDLNKQINETLVKSDSFAARKNISIEHLGTPVNKTDSLIGKQGFHKTVSHESPAPEASPESYDAKLKKLRKELNGDIAEDYNSKPYDSNGIYYEHHKEDPNYLNYEKQWYENMTKVVENSKQQQQPVHTFNPNMNVENFTATANQSYVYHHDPHSPYEHIPDLHHEYMNHDITDGSFNEKNISKLNEEAMDGAKKLHKNTPYDKLLDDHKLQDDPDQSWNAANISKLNLEAAKGQKYYHDVATNGSETMPTVFDNEVQKIIDSAINEAKNGTDVDRYYFQGEKESNDHFGEVKVAQKTEIMPTVEMNTMFTALDGSHKHIDKAMNKHQIDEQTKNDANKYLEKEDRYINNMFYEESNDTNASANKVKSENSEKKDRTPTNVTESKPLAKQTGEETTLALLENAVKTLQVQNTTSSIDNATILQNTTASNLDKLNATESQNSTLASDSVSPVTVEMKNSTKNAEVKSNSEKPAQENVKDLEKEFFVTNSSSGENKQIFSIFKPSKNESTNEQHANATVDKTINSTETTNSTAASKKSNLKDDTDENDYLIKQVQRVASEFIKDDSSSDKLPETVRDIDATQRVVKDIDSASSFGELEKAINEIKANKNTMDLVHQFANGPEIQLEKEGISDKRNVKIQDVNKAHKMMEEINRISYVDDDDMNLLGEAIHRTLIPVKNDTKRNRVEKGIAKRTKISKVRKSKSKAYKSLVNDRFKRSKIEIPRRHRMYKRRFHKDLPHGKWRHLPIVGSKKNLIEETDEKKLQESFIKNLTSSQQKMIWHILDKAYHNKSETIGAAAKSNMTSNQTAINNMTATADKPKENLNMLFDSFMSEQPEESHNITTKPENVTINDAKQGVGKHDTPQNHTAEGKTKSDPYVSIEKAIKPEFSEKTSVGASSTNQASVPMHPSNSNEAIEPLAWPTNSTMVPIPDEGMRNTGLLGFNNEEFLNSNGLGNNPNNSLDPSNFDMYDDGGNQFFFKDGSKKEKVNDMKKKTGSKIKGVADGETTLKELPNIMKHLESVEKQMSNESREALQKFKMQSEDSSMKVTGKPCVSVITDGDDIFHLPSAKCTNVKKNETENSSETPLKKDKCKTHYISIEKNGFTYKIPAVKCEKDGKETTVDGKLKISDIVSGDAKITDVDENKTEKPQVTCNPELSGCITKEAENIKGPSAFAPSVNNKGKTVDVIKIAKTDRNEKVLYKGKNLVMTQNELGAEKIMINGSNKMIEIGYPPEGEKDGFITLKQGNRFYKLPYKNNHEASTEDEEELPGRSNDNWLPDYVREKMMNTETFKVRDTEITKETYKSGGKVIKMEKNSASLSIFYPPKNKSSNFQDKGFMVLKENGKTYNIPLDGTKTFKTIGNQTFLGSDAFKNEEKTASPLQADQVLSKMQSLVPDVSTTDDNRDDANGDISHIKERRFRNDDFQYKPKAYRIDKDRHQKHWIEEEPERREQQHDRDDFTDDGPDDRDPREEEREEEERKRHEERSDDNINDDIQARDDGRLHSDPDHIEVFPTVAYHGLDLKEFGASPREFGASPRDHEDHEDREETDTDQPLASVSSTGAPVEDTETNQNHHQPLHENDEDERSPLHQDIEKVLHGDDNRGDGTIQEDSDESAPLIPPQQQDNQEDNLQQLPRPFREDEATPNLVDENKPAAFLEQADIDSLQRPNVDGDRNHDLRQPFLESHKEAQNNGDEDDDFFPLKEDFTPMRKNKQGSVPSLIVPPQFVAGGIGLQNLHPFSNTRLPEDSKGNVFVTGLREGKEENVEITPISGSMNPDINDRNRLEDFSAYAMGRDLKSVKGRKHRRRRHRNKKLSNFVKEIMTENRGKALLTPPSDKSLRYMNQIHGSTMKRLGAVFNVLQAAAMKNYMHPSNDKLDKFDKTTLRKLGYSDSEFYKINKQITGKKKTILADVGIEVNGKKVGNTNLLMKQIPHVQG